MILIVEVNEPAFVQRFWEFIKDGGYEIMQEESEKRNCYRFSRPRTEAFPKMVELFSRTPDAIPRKEGMYLTPIPTEEGLSSLSAILLNEAYYDFTKIHSAFKNNIHFAKPHAIICLKAYAYLSNQSRQDAGQAVRTDDILKHKYDVFRMVLMLRPDDVFELPQKIQADLQQFADVIKDVLPDPAIFKANGFGTVNVQAVFEQLLKSFNLKA